MSAALACHYCGRAVTRPWEYQRDHFPRPRAAGGRMTVVACNECHHVKDRSPDNELLQRLDDEIAALRLRGPDRPGFLQSWVAFLGDHADGVPEVAYRTARRNWAAWPVTFRLLAARMLRLMDWRR